MSRDLTKLQSQLLGAFFEESFEGLERLEDGLLQLDAGFDAATINDIFRAAHSIKGAAGTFGFGFITELAHDLETLLDAVRSGRLQPAPSLVETMLEAVDVLRGVLGDVRDGRTADIVEIAPLRRRLQDAVPSLVVAVPGVAAAPAASPRVVAGLPLAASACWRITFAPHPDILDTGNEPWRLVRELEALGAVNVQCELDRLPSLVDLDPTKCFLAWTFRLQGETTAAAIQEVFAWVVDDCRLTVVPETAGSGASPPTVVAEAGATLSATAPASASPSPRNPRSSRARRHETDTQLASLRVAVEKIDALMNMVGELVIIQSRLGELDGDGPVDERRLGRIREGLSQLARNSRSLQESVMRLRSTPISVVFNRIPRLVHDLSNQLGKSVELCVTGQSTELDKTVLEKLSGPLVHLVRNSLDHGVETPAERLAAGKSERGTVTVAAFHRGGDLIIEVRDDGRGLDRARLLAKARERGLVPVEETPSDAEILNLIFAPGFSTAQTVTDVSGRGVGMDVVRRNIKSLGGDIRVDSIVGQGTTVALRLPLTLAIIDGQLVRTGGRPYVVPLLSIVESVQLDRNAIKSILGTCDVYRMRDQLIPIVDLARILDMTDDHPALASPLLVIVQADGQRLGLLVDDLQGQQQVVVKSVEANCERVPGLSGATILSDGSVAFILDVAAIAKLARTTGGVSGLRTPSAAASAHA